MEGCVASADAVACRASARRAEGDEPVVHHVRNAAFYVVAEVVEHKFESGIVDHGGSY